MDPTSVRAESRKPKAESRKQKAEGKSRKQKAEAEGGTSKPETGGCGLPVRLSGPVSARSSAFLLFAFCFLLFAFCLGYRRGISML